MDSNLNLLSEDVTELEASIIDVFNSLQVEAGESQLSIGEPRYVFLKALAYVFASYSALINEQLKQNFIEYAAGANLDALGKLTGTLRLNAVKSSCTVTFNRVAGTQGDILIPKHTRVTADSVIYFETRENAIIKDGQNTINIIVDALEAGSKGNGFKAGSITQIVDTIAYVKSVTNINISSGGADAESDDNYRTRIFLAPETFTVAGSKQAYIYHTKSVSSLISDVAVTSPRPGEVNIYLLLKGGVLPESELIDEVTKKISADKVRPLTDKVSVLAPIKKEYEIDMDYYLYEDKPVIPDEKVQQVVDEFIEYQKQVLGRDVNTDILIHNMQELGVKRVVIRKPPFIKVEDNQLAWNSSKKVTFKGLEIE